MPEYQNSSSEVLLAEYVRSRSEEHFCELVRRHLPMVHSTAARLGNGNLHRAQDVSQIVFSDLARKAAQLPQGTVVAGWLYQHAWFTTSKIIRSEHRRAGRETEAHSMSEISRETERDPLELSGLRQELDSAINSLPPADRDTLVLRFFENEGLKRIGQSLGVSEDAAQKRVSRALEKLRSILAQRGLTLSAAALAAALGETIGTAGVAAQLVPRISSAALACGGAAGGGIATLLGSLKFKAALAGLLGIALCAPFVQQQRLSSLAQQNAALQGRVDALEALQTENVQLRNEFISEEQRAKIKADQAELYRLRGEITLLRQEAASPVASQERRDLETPSTTNQLSVLIDVRAAELRHDLLPVLQQQGFPAVADPRDFTINAAGALVKTVTTLFQQTIGVDFLSAPRLQTGDGIATSFHAIEEQIIQGEKVEVGISMDVVPHILPGNLATELELRPSVNIVMLETLNDEQPVFRTWSDDIRAIVSPGNMLLLGRSPKASRDLPNAENKLLILCVTAKVVDSFGKPVLAPEN